MLVSFLLRGGKKNLKQIVNPIPHLITRKQQAGSAWRTLMAASMETVKSRTRSETGKPRGPQETRDTTTRALEQKRDVNGRTGEI